MQRALYTDCAVILPDLYFEKVDKATMAHGVEVRVPLVDTRLAAYVMALPAKYKVRWLHKKRILRRALRGVVPDEILGLSEGRLRGARVALAEDDAGGIHEGRVAGRCPA